MLMSFFMKPEVVKHLDSKYNRTQWAGEEYLLEEIIDESKDKIPCLKTSISLEKMYWIGYIYRYWHYYKNEPSKKIIRQANFKTMSKNYLMFHILDPELVIDNLIEIKKTKIKITIIYLLQC